MKQKKRILVVDDVAMNLSVIENALKSVYEVIPVNSGSRALRYLEREMPDLILLDIRMQYKDGIETLREIRDMEDRQHVPVIMLTSAHDRETVMKSAELGICDYILKPFDTEELRRRIARALNPISNDPPFAWQRTKKQEQQEAAQEAAQEAEEAAKEDAESSS